MGTTYRVQALIDGAGERGLCAGGDLRIILDDALHGGGEASRRLWRDEYPLNARIANHPKPFIAIVDGLVMGGGSGLSADGDVRIATERCAAAMPEVGIGLVPSPLRRGHLTTLREWIDACCTADSVEEVLLGLQARNVAEARFAANDVTTAPTALPVTLGALRHARLPDTLEQDAGPGVPHVVQLSTGPASYLSISRAADTYASLRSWMNFACAAAMLETDPVAVAAPDAALRLPAPSWAARRVSQPGPHRCGSSCAGRTTTQRQQPPRPA